MIEVNNIESSAIDKVSYDPEEKILYVEFATSKKNYAYSDVTESEFKDLLTAPSIGSFIAIEIVPNKEFQEV